MDQETRIHMNVSHDGGNGYCKDYVLNDVLTYPSELTKFLEGMTTTPIQITDYNGVKQVLDNFINEMDVTVDSESLHESGVRYLVGTNANYAGKARISFNVDSAEGKSDRDISLVCILAVVAYSAISKDFITSGEVKDNYEVVVDKMNSALPIDEIKIPGVSESFAKKFNSKSHVVTINNFSRPVQVKVNFDKVKILPEGLISQLGLIWDPKNPNYFRSDSIFNTIYTEDESVSISNGEDILEIGNVLGIDIGEGTTDFSLMNGISNVAGGSSSIFTGIGNVAEDAAEAFYMQYPQLGRYSRQSFMESMRNSKGKKKEAFEKAFQSQVDSLGSQITDEIRNSFQKVNNNINLIVVFGGGATILKDFYENDLEEAVKSLSPFETIPLLWVAPKYAQNLNLDGLRVALEKN